MTNILTDETATRAGEPAAAPLQRQTNALRRILVVEDDRDIRQINAMVLHHAGYYVDTAEDGASGWKALKAGRYDVLITDNNMPLVTGLELIKKLRSEEMPLSVILATGTMPTEELERHPWLRVDAMLLKPYSPEAILGAVKMVLGEGGNSQGSGSLDLKDNETPPAVKVVSAPIQPQARPPRRILVVDNEPDIRHLNAEVLENSGYSVDIAEDGIAGWKALHAVSHAPESYALLITDHDMPGLSRLALVKKMRAARMALPVIMATGALPPETLFIRYPWLQPVVTLVKPYSIGHLLRTVQKILLTDNGARAEIAPTSNWQGQSLPNKLQL